MTDWVRLWHDMPTDPKWRVIARKSGQPLPCVIALFTLLMTTASSADDRGCVTSLSVEDAAAALDMDEADVAAILSAMDGRVIAEGRLSGWERRQPKREDSSADRVKAFRERKRTQGNDEKRDVTLGNAPEKSREEEDTEKNPPTPLGGKAREYAFQAKVIQLTRGDFDEWRNRFHAIPDFTAELGTCDDWLQTQNEAKRKQWFGTASSWLAKRHQEALANRQRAGPRAVVGL